MRKTLLLLTFVALAAASGCSTDSQFPTASGKASFRAINAIPTSPSISFLIEERTLDSVDYKGNSSVSEFDDLDYRFNFEVLLAGEFTFTRVANTFVETVKDKSYTFVITGALNAPTITTWERDEREWAGNETVFELSFAHTAESLGDIDVYFAAPGIPPAPGQAVGTLSFTQILPPADYPEGDYVVIFTTANDPADILFTSNTVAPAAQTGNTISVFDGDPNDLGPLSVRILGESGSNSALPDVNDVPTVRFYHAATGLATSDIYVDEAVTDRLVMDHAFRDVTGDLPIAAGVNPITYTTAGDVGMILHEGTASIFNGSRHHFYIVGATDALVSFTHIPDRRPIETNAKFTFLHAATNHPLVDLYLVDVGGEISESIPVFFGVAVGGVPLFRNIIEGDFDMYLTAAGEVTPIAGPILLNSSLGDIIEVISYDNVDPATADLAFIPLP